MFRLRLVDGDYYFGMVIEGNIEAGPFSPFGVLAVLFAGSSADGVLTDPDSLADRQLLIPPFIVYPRPWTVGYAEKIGEARRFPRVDYVFNDLAFRKHVDQHGNEVEVPKGITVGDCGALAMSIRCQNALPER